MSALILAPEGYDPVASPARVEHALRYLLTANPNRYVGYCAVVEALGFRVCDQAVSHAAARLRRGPFGLPIVSKRGRGGGYMLLVPVRCEDERECCATCSSRTFIHACRALKGRPVEGWQWCGGWTP